MIRTNTLPVVKDSNVKDDVEETFSEAKPDLDDDVVDDVENQPKISDKVEENVESDKFGEKILDKVVESDKLESKNPEDKVVENVENDKLGSDNVAENESKILDEVVKTIRNRRKLWIRVSGHEVVEEEEDDDEDEDVLLVGGLDDDEDEVVGGDDDDVKVTEKTVVESPKVESDVKYGVDLASSQDCRRASTRYGGVAGVAVVIKTEEEGGDVAVVDAEKIDRVLEEVVDKGSCLVGVEPEVEKVVDSEGVENAPAAFKMTVGDAEDMSVAGLEGVASQATDDNGPADKFVLEEAAEKDDDDEEGYDGTPSDEEETDGVVFGSSEAAKQFMEELGRREFKHRWEKNITRSFFTNDGWSDRSPTSVLKEDDDEETGRKTILIQLL
ncbi:hypothetical protein Tco_1181453 [Tanacetum coccineum]